jgi:hypothetical protein
MQCGGCLDRITCCKESDGATRQTQTSGDGLRSVGLRVRNKVLHTTYNITVYLQIGQFTARKQTRSAQRERGTSWKVASQPPKIERTHGSAVGMSWLYWVASRAALGAVVGYGVYRGGLRLLEDAESLHTRMQEILSHNGRLQEMYGGRRSRLLDILA